MSPIPCVSQPGAAAETPLRAPARNNAHRAVAAKLLDLLAASPTGQRG